MAIGGIITLILEFVGSVIFAFGPYEMHIGNDVVPQWMFIPFLAALLLLVVLTLTANRQSNVEAISTLIILALLFVLPSVLISRILYADLVVTIASYTVSTEILVAFLCWCVAHIIMFFSLVPSRR